MGNTHKIAVMPNIIVKKHKKRKYNVLKQTILITVTILGIRVVDFGLDRKAGTKLRYSSTAFVHLLYFN